MISFTSLAVLAFIFVAVGFLRRAFNSRPAPLPPGPRGLPLIGNVLDMPTEYQWKVFAQWAQIWGDIIYVSVIGQPIVILNSPKVAFDLLDKRSNIYSARALSTMGGELVGWKHLLPLMTYGPVFKEQRRLLHRAMGTKASAGQFNSIQETSATRLLKCLLETPEDFSEHIRQIVGDNILIMSHGYSVRDDVLGLVSTVDQVQKDFVEFSTPGKFLVDVFPVLQRLPTWVLGPKYHTGLAAYRQTKHNMIDIPHEFVKTQMAAGTAVPSFTSGLLDVGMTPNDEFLLKHTSAAFFAGGTETTISALHSFFLAMTVYPDVQKRAQAELDAVISSGTLPVIADRERLPYMDALVKEIFRWHPVLPISLPHAASEDDIYEGKFIPKGSIIIPNTWKFLHDPEIYANPMEFNPARFLPSSKEGRPEQDPREYSFGYGRRICPGLLMADASVFIFAAMTLIAFNISKPTMKDNSGNVVEVEPAVEFTSGLSSRPKPFQCAITVRSDKAATLIRSIHEV